MFIALLELMAWYGPFIYEIEGQHLRIIARHLVNDEYRTDDTE